VTQSTLIIKEFGKDSFGYKFLYAGFVIFAAADPYQALYQLLHPAAKLIDPLTSLVYPSYSVSN
jgi:hypothetical protein